MKKMFKFFTFAAIVTAGFTSCTKEEGMSNANTVDDVKNKANLTVYISGNTPTRAINDVNATAEESMITSATIFVFNAQNAYQADTTITITTANEDPSNDNKYKVEFQAPTGNDKRVFVGLNFSDKLKNAVKQNGLSAIYSSINDQEYLFYKSSTAPSGSLTFKGNPMFNEKPEIISIVKGQTNTVGVTVERLTAKITVAKEGTLAAGDVKAANATFSNKSLKFALANKNTKVFPMRQPQWMDPNWDGSAYQSDFENEFNIKGKDYTNWDVKNFVDVDDATTAITARKAKYALENTHKTPNQTEVTYISVMSKFEPDAIATSFDEINKRAVLNTQTSSINKDTLHTVVDNNSYYYYTDRVEAQKHVDYINSVMGGNSAEYITYYGQYCFFNVWLNSDKNTKDYQLKRNEYYSVGLAGINRLGDAYPSVKPVIIGETSSISVTINVKAWSLIDMSGINLGD